ncbi:MAG: glycosyltransferase family 39 protein [Candidatus Pacebacteria bacterium]|nr:glycosyltransferase family 39 protein [Candidatus Paceibacterota bacterium]
MISKKLCSIYTFFLVLLIFGYFYADMIFSLPLFGDATIQGSITKQIINNGVLNAKSSYPPLYHIFQGILFSFFGEKGMNFIVFLGILLIAISIFLLTKELAGKTSIALLSTIITLGSPKIIFYSARMYMEILISGFFIFSIYLLIKFIKNKSVKNLGLLSFFVGITASIKQQGLFILFFTILLFLLVFLVKQHIKNRTEKISNYNPFKGYITIFISIFLVTTILPYLVLFHNYGKIMEGNEDFKIIKMTNIIGQKISGYEKAIEDIKLEKKWGQRLKEIENKYYSVGAKRAEARHIWPWEPLTSWNKFTQANSLYLEKFWAGSTTKELTNIMNFSLVFGLIIFIFNLIFKNKILKFKEAKLLMPFSIFLIIFLGINYLLFVRNTDQMRYHLFIPILLSVFSAIGLYFLFKFIIEKTRVKYDGLIAIFLILALLLYSTITLAYKDTNFNKRWNRSQLYSPSKGGIASQMEVGSWLYKHTNDNERIWQSCGNELAYYSGRKVIGGFEYYFLNEAELKEIFKDTNIKYIALFDSQIVTDEKWESLCWIPMSFADKIRKIYPLVYGSSYGDIKIYGVL